MKFTKVAAVVAGLVASASAGATSWTSFPDVNNANAFLTAGTSIYCSTTSCNAGSVGTLTGSIIKLTAYSTSATTANPVAAFGASPNDSTDWITAQLRIYSGTGGGISIANTTQPSSTETTSPQHAIDNSGLNDILVVDFGSQDGSTNWDVSQFTLGYICSMSSATACSGTTGVNVDAWLGGNGSTVFGGASGIHFTSTTVLSGGFTRLPLSNDDTTNTLRVDTSANPQPQGRYLVITGDLASFNDSFKITGITAAPGTTTTQQAPAPGSVALIALGLLALTWTYRRRPARVRAS